MMIGLGDGIGIWRLNFGIGDLYCKLGNRIGIRIGDWKFD